MQRARLVEAQLPLVRLAREFEGESEGFECEVVKDPWIAAGQTSDSATASARSWYPSRVPGTHFLSPSKSIMRWTSGSS